MKQKLFNKGTGWYISANNYKNKQDKAYMNVHFSRNHCVEPTYIDNGRGFSVMDVDIQEAMFTSYKGKVGMTIFKFEQLSDLEFDSSKFGGSIETNIEPEDLPFY